MKLSGDLRSAKTIYFKGFLFLVIAALSAGLVIAKTLRWDVALLLAVCIWASCRAYYFAFYVIEKYVDAEFRFSGLVDFVKYVLRKK